MIVHASIDENGKAKGGAAGDQTKKEVCTRSYYLYGGTKWDCMLRYQDSELAKKASEIAVKLANSNLVGYDQNQRNTLYTQLKKNNFNVDAYIKTGVKSETDCSAFMYAVWCCLIPAMRNDSNAPTTSTMKNIYPKYGFKVYTESKYVGSDKELKKGDILLKPGHHTVMNIDVMTASPAPIVVTSSKDIKIKITTNKLNIRKGPGTNYAKTGSYASIGTTYITEEKAGTGSKKGWGKLKDGKGWIALDYATKVK